METIKQIREMYEYADEIEYSDPHGSFEIAKKAYELSEKIGYMKGEADGLYQMSCACRVMSDYGQCLRCALQALKIYEATEDNQGCVNTNMMIGIVYFYSGDYSSALKYFVAAENGVVGSVPEHRAIAAASNIGEVYREAGNYEMALESYEKAIAIAVRIGYESKVSYVYNNISQVYMMDSDYESAYRTCLKAMKEMHNGDDDVSVVTTEYIFGRLLMLQGDYSKADKYYNNSMIKLKKMNNKFYMIELLINMSELAALEGRDGLSYLMDALDTASEIDSVSKMSRVYKLLSEYYEGIDDYKTAISYYKNYHMTEKEIEAGNLSQRLALLLVEIDYSKEKNERKQLEALSEKLNRDRNSAIEELEKIRRENIQLQKQSTIDDLTQVLNKRGIYTELEEVLTEKEGQKSALFIVDIDHFKNYNDTWGHLQGDKSLSRVAKALNNVHKYDFTIGRFGGEEFVCHTFVDNKNEAEEIALKINKSIEALKIQTDPTDLDKYLTVSIGGVVGHMSYGRVSHWLDIADQKLYDAKGAGRNRFTLIEVEA